MKALTRRPAFWIAVVIAAAVLVTLLGACGDPQQARPVVACATYQAPDGTWMESDNEEVDSDPCDLDDLFENKVRTTAPAKPVPKASPAKPNVRTTKR